MIFRSVAHRGFWPGAFKLVVACTLAACLVPASWADATDRAKRIHDRIAGVPPDAQMLSDMVDLINANPQTGHLDAALLVTEQADEFYNVTLKNFAAPWTNRDQSVFVALNDYTATIIGMVRDDFDFREILSADVLYIGSGAGISGYSRTSNQHYEDLEAQGVNLAQNLQSAPQSSLTGVPAGSTAGIITTRAAAKAYFIDGTNRAMFRFTLLNHMCRDLEQVKDITRVPDRIRQDVSRSPGGDSRIFLNNCIGCHTGMDPLTQSFAHYDYIYDSDLDPDGENGELVYDNTEVASKYFNNNNNFEAGFVTPNESWSNYWREGQNALLGWDSSLPGTGSGAKSMGTELAHSNAFAQCQVEKVFENVCLHPVEDSTDRAQITSMVSSFRTSGYNLKQVFAESAVYCMGN